MMKLCPWSLPVYVLTLFFHFPLPALALETNRDLHFSKACEPGTQVTIAAVGDLLLHAGLQTQAYRSSEGFQTLWQEATPYIQKADIGYANLEGPVAQNVRCDGKTTTQKEVQVGPDCRKADGSVYTSYPRFNYHPRLLSDLVDSGFDIVSVANNHSLNRGSKGANVTIQNLTQSPLQFSGIRKHDDPSWTEWFGITVNNDKVLAWISCTYDTNGIRDKFEQVLHCFQNDDVSNIIKGLKPNVDGIIVVPHWGKEYKTTPSPRQKEYARKWLDDGAIAILGSHPHVIQPWEKYITKDGRETFIAYSMGNFVSGQTQMARRTTAIFFIGLTFNDNQVWVNGVRYTPAYMKNQKNGPHRLLVENLSEAPEGETTVKKFLGGLLGSARIFDGQGPLITNSECGG